jgi:hypothetical protein
MTYLLIIMFVGALLIGALCAGLLWIGKYDSYQ